MNPAIVIEDLSYAFGSGDLRRQVLTDIRMEVAAGEIVLLTGPSGSGKTTLLTLIGGLRASQGGRLQVLGRELTGSNERSRTLARREHGYIFQSHNLHGSLTALQNVRMALEMRGTLSGPEMDRRSRSILASVGLEELCDAFPDLLSGGERQRVAVARALVGAPPLVLADEPTAALDRRSGRDVVTLLQRLAREHRRPHAHHGGRTAAVRSDRAI